jgi:hypothetical protein
MPSPLSKSDDKHGDIVFITQIKTVGSNSPSLKRKGQKPYGFRPVINVGLFRYFPAL